MSNHPETIYQHTLKELFDQQLTPSEYSDDIDVFKRWLNIVLLTNPENPQYNALMGDILIDEKQYEAAIPYLLQSLKQNPENDNTEYQLGMAYYYTNRYADTIPIMDKMLAIYPNDDDAEFMLAHSCMKMGQKSNALMIAKTMRRSELAAQLKEHPEALQDFLL